MGQLYTIINGAMTTTAPAVGVTTSATLYTLLQVKPAANVIAKVVEWGVSFDGSAAASPFGCDLVETDVAATVTASVLADIMPFDGNAIANTSGTSGVPFNLGTAATGYTSSAEGTITVNRVFDVQFVAPTNQYVKQFPLGREPEINTAKFLRIRVKGDGTRKAICYCIIEV